MGHKTDLRQKPSSNRQIFQHSLLITFLTETDVGYNNCYFGSKSTTMERYIRRNWFTQLQKEASDPSDGRELNRIVHTDKDHRPARLIQMYAGMTGLLAVLAGIFVLFADILGSGEGTAKFMSLFPFILGLGLYIFYKMKHSENNAFRELSSAFLAITFFFTLVSSMVTFKIDLDADQLRYVIYIGLAAALGITYMNKSSLTAFVFMIFLVIWSGSAILGGFLPFGIGSVFGSGVETVIVFWVFFAGIVYFLLTNLNTTEINLKTVILGWLVGVLAIAGASSMTGGQTFLADAAMIFALYVFGKKYYSKGTAFWNRPFQTIAIVMASAYFLAFCHGDAILGSLLSSGVFTEFETPQILGLVISLGLMGGSLFYYHKNHWSTGDKLNQFMALVPLLALLSFLVGFAKDPDFYGFVGMIYTAAGIVLFGMWVKYGIAGKHVPITLLGVVTLLSILLTKTTAVQGESAMVMGLYLIFVGGFALFLTFYLDKAWGMGNFKGLVPDELMDKMSGGLGGNTGVGNAPASSNPTPHPSPAPSAAPTPPANVPPVAPTQPPTYEPPTYTPPPADEPPAPPAPEDETPIV